MNNAICENKDVCDFYEVVKTRLEGVDCIKNAFNLAYRDLQRTLRGFSKCEERDSIKNEVLNLFRSEYENLVSPYKVVNSKQFDSWHKLLCDKIKAVFGYKFSFSYGQAQKLINMFLKYMYLVDSRLNSISQYLHIPIDNVILDGIEKQSSYFSLQRLVASCRPWSKLDNYENYMEFQWEWKRIFNQPLLNEFRLWNKWSKAENNKVKDSLAI